MVLQLTMDILGGNHILLSPKTVPKFDETPDLVESPRGISEAAVGHLLSSMQIESRGGRMAENARNDV